MNPKSIVITLVVAATFLSTTADVFATNWIPFPDTGQTKCYDGSGHESNCPSEGHHLYGQDAQYSGAQLSFHDNGDGTVTDNNTHLMWLKGTVDYNGDGVVDSSYESEDRATLSQAIDYCHNLTINGFSGWRLPSPKEFVSIVDFNWDGDNPNSVFNLLRNNGYWAGVVGFLVGSDGNTWGSLPELPQLFLCVR